MREREREWERYERERESILGREGRSQGKESKEKRTGTNVLHGEVQINGCKCLFKFLGEEKTCLL